jgi:membrane-associated phospholipid phosphatase
VSALASYRVHRRLGLAALVCATLVAISTLFTKQHYVADLVAGIILALVAYAVFLRNYSRENIPDLERRLAPLLALCAGVIVVFCIAVYWAIFTLQAQG